MPYVKVCWASPCKEEYALRKSLWGNTTYFFVICLPLISFRCYLITNKQFESFEENHQVGGRFQKCRHQVPFLERLFPDPTRSASVISTQEYLPLELHACKQDAQSCLHSYLATTGPPMVQQKSQLPAHTAKQSA